MNYSTAHKIIKNKVGDDLDSFDRQHDGEEIRDTAAIDLAILIKRDLYDDAEKLALIISGGYVQLLDYESFFFRRALVLFGASKKQITDAITFWTDRDTEPLFEITAPEIDINTQYKLFFQTLFNL